MGPGQLNHVEEDFTLWKNRRSWGIEFEHRSDRMEWSAYRRMVSNLRRYIFRLSLQNGSPLRVFVELLNLTVRLGVVGCRPTRDNAVAMEKVFISSGMKKNPYRNLCKRAWKRLKTLVKQKNCRSCWIRADISRRNLEYSITVVNKYQGGLCFPQTEACGQPNGTSSRAVLLVTPNKSLRMVHRPPHYHDPGGRKRQNHVVTVRSCISKFCYSSFFQCCLESNMKTTYLWSVANLKCMLSRLSPFSRNFDDSVGFFLCGGIRSLTFQMSWRRMLLVNRPVRG